MLPVSRGSWWLPIAITVALLPFPVTLLLVKVEYVNLKINIIIFIMIITITTTTNIITITIIKSLHHHLVACQDDRHRQHWQTVQGSQPHGYQGRIKVNFTTAKEKLKEKYSQGGNRVFSFVSNFLLSSLVEIGKDHVPAKRQCFGHISQFFVNSGMIF